MTKRHRKPDEGAPVGKMGYEVECRDLLHIKGGYEITIVFVFEAVNDEGERLSIKQRLSEADFGRFVADVGLDVFRIRQMKDPTAKPPQFGDPNRN